MATKMASQKVVAGNGSMTNAVVATSESAPKLAIVLVRGLARITTPIYDTLLLLRLTKKNHCIVVDDSPAYRGMLQKVKDFVTWGEISEKQFKELVAKRGVEYTGREMDRKKLYSYKTLNMDNKKYLPYFCLNPPRKGFGRKGIKVAFKAGGGLGYRGDKINDLIARMV